MKKKNGQKKVARTVLKHLQQDTKEFKSQIRDDAKLKKKLKPLTK
jgi:hypothetical protein